MKGHDDSVKVMSLRQEEGEQTLCDVRDYSLCSWLYFYREHGGKSSLHVGSNEVRLRGATISLHVLIMTRPNYHGNSTYALRKYPGWRVLEVGRCLTQMFYFEFGTIKGCHRNK